MGSSVDNTPWQTRTGSSGFGYSSRDDYLNQARSGYSATSDPGKVVVQSTGSGSKTIDLLTYPLTTDASWPVIILNDVTGSMDQWPAVIFGKLEYLWHELKTSYGDSGAAISFGAIGDAVKRDKYPLQIRPFGRGEELVPYLGELVREGGGGGGGNETYELAAVYLSHHLSAPNLAAGRKPLVIFIGDEAPYDSIDADLAERFAKVNYVSVPSVQHVFDQLKQTCSVYIIRKPYEDYDSRIHQRWQQLLGEGRVLRLDQPERVVDVIFGILAAESDKLAYFKKELQERQKIGQVDTVMSALGPALKAHKQAKDLSLAGSGHSVILGLGDGEEHDSAKPLV